MKKLILLCFALLVGALQIVSAQKEKTVTIVPASGTKYYYWEEYKADGNYEGNGTEAPYSGNINPVRIKADDIIIDFPDPTTAPSGAQFVKLYAANMQVYCGFDFTIRTTDPDYKIKKVIFNHNTLYNQGYKNFSCLTEGIASVSSLTVPQFTSSAGVSEMRFNIKNLEGGAVAPYKSVPLTETSLRAFLTSIEVTYVGAPFIGVPRLLDNTSGASSEIKNGSEVTIDYLGEKSITFGNNADTEVDNQEFYYYIEKGLDGAVLTEIPASKWIKWDGNALKISEPCRVYYVAENPDYPGKKSEMGYADFNVSLKFVGIPKVYDKTTGIYSTKLIQDGETLLIGYGDVIPLAFEKNTSSSVINQKYLYYKSTRGVDVLSDIINENWDEWVLNSKYLEINEDCRLYYTAVDPNYPNLKRVNDVGYIDFKVVPQHTIFDYSSSSVNGVLTIWSDTYPQGKIWVKSTNENYKHENIHRMVFVPTKTDDFQPEAFIIDFIPNAAGKTSDIDPIDGWIKSYTGSGLKIYTQNGAVYMNRITFGSYNTDSNNRYLNYSTGEPGENQVWEAGSYQRTYIRSTRDLSLTTSTTTYGAFKKLSIQWEPSQVINTVAAPEAPVGTALSGSNDGGLIRFIDEVDVMISAKQGNARYALTSEATDNTLNNFPSSKIKAAYPGQKITLTKNDYGDATTFRILMESDYYTNSMAKSGVSQMFFQPVQAQGFSALSELISKDNVDKELTVRPTKEMQIVGVYKTRLDGATTEALTTYYAYLVDADGTAIKLVSQGKDFPAAFYAADDLKLPVNGFVGDFRYTYGSPEIVINSKSAPYHDLLGTPVKGRIDGYDPNLPERLEITTTPTDDQFVTDFNRKVVVRNLTWLRSNNEVADEDGNRYQIYSRLVVRDANGADLDAEALTSDMFKSEAGTKWLVEGFVGQVNGKTAIFPTAKVRPCPVRPTLYAPNEIEGDVNVISDAFTVTLSELPEGMEARYSFDADVKSENVVPAEGLVIRKADFTDGVRDLYVYTYDKNNDVWSLHASHVKFHAYDAKEAKSIAEFKEVFIGHEKDWFDADGVLTEQAIADNGLSLYYQLSGSAVVIKRTPEYLYLRDLDPTDGSDFLSKNYLMVHNGKAWEQPKVDNTDADAAEGAKRVLRPGDVIHGVALMANLTSLGNLRSETTNFARTVVYDRSIDSTSVAPREVKVSYEEGGDIYYEDIKLGDTDRMMYLTLKGVEVTDESRDTERYFLRIGDGSVPVRLSFDIFTVRSGWSTAYKKGSLYDITGVFMRDGEDGFALAMTDFGGLAGDTEEPQLFLAGHPDLAGNEVQAGLHDLQFEMTVPEGAIGYYAIGGVNPLHNVTERHTYTPGDKVALTFDEGQDRVVVMAFAAEPGKTPSAVVARTFVKNTREMSYLLNFINQGVQDNAYHFNSAVRIVSVSGQNMFVRGSVGHYLPIYNADGWDVTKYREGEYVSDFVMLFDASTGNRRGVVNAECSWPEESVALEDYPDENMKEITITPDEVEDISAENARRLVTVSNVVVNVAAPENARAATPTITFKSAIDGSVAHLLNTAELGELDDVDFEDGAYYDITGFVMLNGTEVELWPTDAKRIPMTADVTVKIDDKSISPVADGEYLEYAESFYPATKVKLECSNQLSTTRIYYSYDNKEWFTYGEPFIVTASQSCIHAYAVAEGRRPSRHTHIALTRLEPSGDVDFELAPDEAKGVTMVTLKALGGAKDSDIRWSKDNFATAGKEYTGPIEISETCILYARVEEEGKVAGETVHALVIVPAVKQDEPQKPVDPEQPDQPENPDQPDQPENPDQPGQAVSGKVKFEITQDEVTGKVYVTISPAEAVAGGFEIYWTDRMGTLTPDNGTPYDFQPIEVTETTYIMAILVETGKKSGAVCGVNVWVNPTPTAIDGINGDRDADAVRAEGSDIIAPEGSVVYDLNGRRVRGEGLRQGIYLVRTPDGTTVKVMIR